MMTLGAVLCSVLVLLLPALGNVGAEEVSQFGLEFGPNNVAVYVGESTTLQCITDGVAGSNPRWYEYATNENGVMISDGEYLLPGHPNTDRYELVLTDSRTYSLKINNINLQDAGYYQCVDSNAAPPSIFRLGAQLVVIESTPNCTTTIPSDGLTIEGQYYTAECSVYYRAGQGIAPLMTWSGPGPYEEGSLVTNTSVWSGIEFYITRDMAGQNWICKTNFTTAGFIAPDTAGNAPVWQHSSPTNQVFVSWAPTNVYADPVKPSYEIGETVRCFADANPEAIFSWQSLKTSEYWYSDTFTTREGMVGYQLMRCQARNTIQGVDYTRDYFLDVYVNPITTTPTTTTPTTTTPPPAWAKCGDLTGRWQSSNPDATVCITVDHDDNANLIGLYRNASDTFWMQLTGKTREGDYTESGFLVIWPSTAIGVTSFAVECHSCHGVETMLANGISRRSKDSEFCATGGLVSNTATYRFYRVQNAWPCAASVKQMEENIAQHTLLHY